MRQVLAWGVARDAAVALRLVAALGWWWLLRDRLRDAYPLLRGAIGCAEPGSDGWCTAQRWAGWAALSSSDAAGALRHFTALRDAVADRPRSRALADALNGRSDVWMSLGQVSEAAEDGRRALAIARQLGYPVGEALALQALAMAAAAVGEVDEALRLVRQADHVPGGIPPTVARDCRRALTEALIQVGDFAAAESACSAGLAWSRDAGDLLHLPDLLLRMMLLDLRADRVRDAVAHLREAVQLPVRIGAWQPGYLDYCGHLCAAAGHHQRRQHGGIAPTTAGVTAAPAPAKRLRRLAAAAAVIGGLLASAAALIVPAASASTIVPNPGSFPGPTGLVPAVQVVSAGLAGWQAALIAVGAAVAAAVTAVVLDRARAARRTGSASIS
jgi:hypothetical protein